MEYKIEIKDADMTKHNFNHLFEVHKDYYETQINKINSNFINDMAKVLISEYRLKYYITFNQLIKDPDEDRSEYDFYNMNFFDTFLETTKNNIRVFSEKDLRILNSIIDLSNLFLKDAIDENNFESLLNSFYQLKNKLELNKFIFSDSTSITFKQTEEKNLFEKNIPLNRR